MKKILTLLVFLLFCTIGYAQCDYIFTDNGGATGNYLPNTSGTYTYCPTQPGKVVTITFTEFNTEAEHDGLYVYNGNSITAPLLASTNGAGFVPGGLAGSYWGNTIPGPFTSTSPNGCLTFVFKTDGINENSGFIAAINACDIITSGFQLNAFLDLNNNSVQDVGENSFPLGEFDYKKNGGDLSFFGYSNLGTVYVPEIDTATIYDFNYTVNSAYSSYYSVSNASVFNVSIGTYPNLVTINFPITSLVNYNDLSVNCTNLNPPKAGFNYVTRISYTNNSNNTINGNLSFVKATALTIQATSEAVTATSTGFDYSFANLLPFETRYINVTLQVPNIPTVALGQLLTNSVNIATTSTEITLNNNTSSVTEAVVASYDPNDITEAHGEKIVYSSFNENDYLFYTIRFENTGTAAAENIIVSSVLDSKIDESAIEMVASSHNYNLTRVENNLSWNFNTINLPVSIENSTIGKGFITYKTKLKPGFSNGDIIPSKAFIFFDTNPAIETNTFTTEFVTTLSNSNFTSDTYFTLSPIPAKEVLYISPKTNNPGSLLAIYNTMGQLVFSGTNTTNQVDVSNLKTGIYFIISKNETGTHKCNFVKL